MRKNMRERERERDESELSYLVADFNYSSDAASVRRLWHAIEPELHGTVQ